MVLPLWIHVSLPATQPKIWTRPALPLALGAPIATVVPSADSAIAEPRLPFWASPSMALPFRSHVSLPAAQRNIWPRPAPLLAAGAPTAIVAPSTDSAIAKPKFVANPSPSMSLPFWTQLGLLLLAAQLNILTFPTLP